MLIRFLDWFIKPLGYRIVSRQSIVIDTGSIEGNAALAMFVVAIINQEVENYPEPPDNVIRFDKYI